MFKLLNAPEDEVFFCITRKHVNELIQEDHLHPTNEEYSELIQYLHNNYNYEDVLSTFNNIILLFFLEKRKDKIREAKDKKTPS